MAATLINDTLESPENTPEVTEDEFNIFGYT